MKMKIEPAEIAFGVLEEYMPTQLNSWEMFIENGTSEYPYISIAMQDDEQNNVYIELDNEQAEMLAHTLLLMVEQNRRQKRTEAKDK